MKIKYFNKYLTFLILLFCFGCASGDSSNSGSSDSNSSAKATIEVGLQESATTSQMPSNSSLFRNITNSISSLADVSSIAVSVENGGTTIINSQYLTQNGDTWQGVIADLPLNTSLTFNAIAYNDSNAQVLSGSTVQTLTGDDTVAITLGQDITVTIPTVTSISIPESIQVSKAASIEFGIAGPANSTHSYQLSPSASDGSFNPNSGSFTPPSSGNITLVSEYTAPVTAGNYAKSITVSQGIYSIVSAFTLNIAADEGSTGVTVLFNPWITRFTGGPRVGSNVSWSVVAGDDKDTSLLSYSWDFIDDGSFPNTGFIDSTSASSTLVNYDETVTGTIQLTITDSDGGSTVVTYSLPAGQFPDCLVNCGNPTARAGDDIDVTLGDLVSLDGTASTDPNNLSLTYDWSIVSKPTGSNVSLSGSTTATPSFTPDEVGIYSVSLTVSNGSTNDMDTVQVTVSEGVVSVTKPTLKMESQGGNSYKVSLLSPQEHQSKGLSGVGNVGIACTGFADLSGYNSYAPTYSGFGSNVSITFNDTDGQLTTANSSLDLYSFTCTATPSFNLGSTVAVTYANTAAITGSSNIDVINP